MPSSTSTQFNSIQFKSIEVDQTLKVGSFDHLWQMPSVTGTFVQARLFIAKFYINQGNICPGDICSYQEYLSYYWTNFDNTFCTQNFGGLNFFLHYFFGTNISFDPNFMNKNYFLTKNFYQNCILAWFWQNLSRFKLYGTR